MTNKTYLNFIETCHELNNLENYTKLIDRVGKFGFEISKVVFRGYLAPSNLQSLHDTTVKTRSVLKLEVKCRLV